MTTENQLLEFLPMDTFGRFINKINFDNLDKFVQMLVSGYISRKGQKTVKIEIDADEISDTSNFLTHIIEVGSMQILMENNMITLDGNENEGSLVSVALAMNIALASSLKLKNVYDWDSPVYYDMPSLQTIFSRIAVHINNAIKDKNYIKPLVDNYLFNKI